MNFIAGSDSNFYQKLQLSEKTLIHHHHFSMAEKRIKDVIRLSQNGVEPRHTLLLGESGTGKSWLAEYIAASFPGGIRDGYKEMPVLIVGIPRYQH